MVGEICPFAFSDFSSSDKTSLFGGDMLGSVSKLVCIRRLRERTTIDAQVYVPMMKTVLFLPFCDLFLQNHIAAATRTMKKRPPRTIDTITGTNDVPLLRGDGVFVIFVRGD